MIRGGIDIGGTFTDIVYIDDETGSITSHKILTTPANPAKGVLDGLAESQGDLSKVWLLVHGTTIVINAIVNRKGARTALITTEGYRDLLEIGRGNRLESFNFFWRRPEPLVPRRWRVGVTERIDWRGNVIVDLDLPELERAIAYLAENGMESVAVCFLNAYANPIHEKRVKQLIESKRENLHVTLSSEVLPEIREFERLSTTVVSAYTKPAAHEYIDELESSLREKGYRADLYLMQSNAGIINSEMAKTSPVQIIESGPVGGIVACKYFAELMGYKNVAVFDMGGTTSKAGLVINGTISITQDYAPEGYAVRTPVADMIELGIGGGSIARVDEEGFLKVGPVSAGADPGPACYGLGGEEPTITDANLVLGRIRALLKGRTRLDSEKARRSLREKIGDILGLDLVSCANGIIEIAVSMLIDELRSVSIIKGIDLREFVMFAFGGAGPMHCALMARDLGIDSIIIPSAAGAFSALGFLCSDLRHDFVKTQIVQTRDLDFGDTQHIFEKLESQGVQTLKREGMDEDNISIIRSLDMRYVGQAYELNIPFDLPIGASQVQEQLEMNFNKSYESFYGHSTPQEPTEIVNFRLTAVGTVKKPPFREMPLCKQNPAPRDKAQVYFEEKGWVECPFYNREDLGHGNTLTGPAVIEEYTSTTVVPPGFEARVDEYLNIIMKRI